VTQETIAAAAYDLLRSGLTVRDISELFRADPKAIEAMIIGLSVQRARPGAASNAPMRATN
jgi:hypothetical protein